MTLLLPHAVIVDMDGTLAIRHPGRSFYDASTADFDLPNEPIVWLVRHLQIDHRILVCSGREEKDRKPTETFLQLHGIRATQVFMRATGDFRKDAIIKREIYTQHIEGKYTIRFVLDDRNQVVQEWRKLGLTCLQVADGNF